MPIDRAVFFVDGNNWYHSLREAGVPEPRRLKYHRVCEKLVGPRHWVETRYYIPDVGIIGDPRLLADQRSFLQNLKTQDGRISVHMGRLEARAPDVRAGKALLRYMADLKVPIPVEVYQELVGLGRSLVTRPVFVEKAVDVQIAVDMVRMAYKHDYETAYLLSADGDFTPAVQAVRELGKKVFAVSLGPGAKLASAVDSYIRLKPDWFRSCV